LVFSGKNVQTLEKIPVDLKRALCFIALMQPEAISWKEKLF